MEKSKKSKKVIIVNNIFKSKTEEERMDKVMEIFIKYINQ
jgi:hypothetical protein